LHWAQKDVSEWLSIVRRGGRDVREALWCLFYADERSPRVLDALREIEKSSTNDEARRIADAILCHWRAEHEAMGAAAYRAPRSAVAPNALFPPPVHPAELADDALESALRSESIDESSSAAIAWILSDLTFARR
jgi:hypothetical protein